MTEETNTVPNENEAKNQENTFADSSVDSSKENIGSEGTDSINADSVIALLKEELQKAKKEADDYKESWQRERAEFQNFKRRSAQEMIHSRRDSVKNFVHGLLTPLDNLERVILNPGKEVSPELKVFVDGVHMIQKELLSVLEKEGIKRLHPDGEPFDPHSMEAIASEEDEKYTEETVIEVYQSGYNLVSGEEVFNLRPSRVRVGRPKQ